MRNILIYPGEDGYFVAEVPSLPGCISQGKTYEIALENIKEAMKLYIETLNEQKKSVPQDHFSVISIDEKALFKRPQLA